MSRAPRGRWLVVSHGAVESWQPSLTRASFPRPAHPRFEEWWNPQLKNEGYDCVYKQRTGLKKDGLMIGWRRDRLQLFRSEDVEFNDICAKLRDRDPNGATRAKQDNVAQMLALQPWEDGSIPSAVTIVNAQLHSEHTAETSEELRTLQAECVSRTTCTHPRQPWCSTWAAAPASHRLARHPPGSLSRPRCRYLVQRAQEFNGLFQLPVILVGSFNCKPSSAA